MGRPFTDPELLARAMAHRSWCAEVPGNLSNERLEFLGDAVLGLVVTDYLYRNYPDLPEGQLAQVRASVVNAEVLAEVAEEIEVGASLKLGKGEDASGGREKPSILADALEAVIGAVYLDAGWDSAAAVVLGLVAARALAEVARNRQVVAYGYDENGAGPGGGPIRLFVYDSHHPDTEVVLAPEPDGGWAASAGGGPWRGLFLQDYARERPPYIDLGAAKGIWVNSWTPTLGGNFVAQFTARNYGDYRAHVSELRLAVRGPAGENLDRFLGGDGDPSPIEPGEERAVFKASDGFGTVPGSYAIAAGYLSEQGCWLPIPPGEPGAVDEVGITVIPPPRRARVTVTFGAVTVEDADALGGLLTLRLAIGDQAVRWPEEGMADVQDGKRFELDQRFDLVLNPSSVLSVSATGSDASGAPAGVVRESYLGLDDWGAGTHTYRSRTLPPGLERPGPDAGDGPWTIEYAVEVTPLEA